MECIANVLIYLDRTYLKFHNKLYVYDLALRIFREYVVYDSRFHDVIQRELLLLISQERAGNVINRSILKDILKMLVDVSLLTSEVKTSSRNVYEEDFETAFLAMTHEYYRQQSKVFISEVCS